MSENQKGGSFKSFFFREVDGPPQTENVSPQVANSIPQGGTQRSNFAHPYPGVVVSNQPTYTAMPSQNLVDDFVDRLQKLIDENNQPGFDFLEFTQSLFESSPNPGLAEYKMVFNIAKKMQASLSPQSLLESARGYKSLIDSAASSTISEGQKKKETLQHELEIGRQSLDAEIKQLDQQVINLQNQIVSLQQQSGDKKAQLSAIDNEFAPKFTDIDSKVSAMQVAKEKVINSIVDVETGIQNYIKS